MLCILGSVNQHYLLKNLDDSGISLPALLSRIYLKLYDTFVTPEFLKKVITKIGRLKPFGPDCFPASDGSKER